MNEEDYEEALKILRSLRDTLSEQQKELARNLADYLLTAMQKTDYEGKQTFHFTDYKTRN